MSSAGTGSVTCAAIAQAAIGMGVPNPMTTADELLLVEVDALHEWFTIAARIQVRLWQGADRISDALPLLAAGWSRTEPQLAIGRHREAGLAGRETVSRQVAAADEAVATLRQSRALTDTELSEAESAVLGLGWSPGEDLLGWSVGRQALPSLVGIIARLQQQLDGLLARNDDALHALAVALRQDPGDPLEPLTAVPRHGTANLGSEPPAPGSPAPASGAAPAVDADNLARLAADLQSSDVSVLAMAVGVDRALTQARQDGGVGQLLVYESASSTSQGRAAISVGDVTTADNVAVFAPGVSSAPVAMSVGIGSAASIRNEAQRQAPGDRTAVVSWYGYDIPLSSISGVPVTPMTAAENLVAALDDGAARDGGTLLAEDMMQFRQWAPETARFIGMGFSMGSTTVSAAAARGAGFDDLALMGSPGASRDVATANDYPEMSAEHVLALSYDNDPITKPATDVLAYLAGNVPLFSADGEPFGPDPASADFGAQVIDAESNSPDFSVSIASGLPGGVLTGAMANAATNELLDLMNHHQEANYLSGESLAAIAAVVNGHYSEVPIKPGR